MAAMTAVSSAASPYQAPSPLTGQFKFLSTRSVINKRTSLEFHRFLRFQRRSSSVLACLPSSSSSSSSSSSAPPSSAPKTRVYVSGLSFRTTEEGLRNAFQNFGQLVEVNLVMDKIARRPRGFAFLRYATEEESGKAIEGMHGKFLDGRVIFVQVAKERSELPRGPKQNR